MKLNADRMLLYNDVAIRALKRADIPVLDVARVSIGRPEESRGPQDGLHASTKWNIEMMRIFLSVLTYQLSQ